MTGFNFVALPSAHARHIQRGSHDAYDMVPQALISDGQGNQCRHCLQLVEQNEPMLVFAYKPFARYHSFAETGPIFVCARESERAVTCGEIPAMYWQWETTSIRGYDSKERIVYGTGQNVPIDQLKYAVLALFENPNVAFVHLRSSKYNCYQCRLERVGETT